MCSPTQALTPRCGATAYCTIWIVKGGKKSIAEIVGLPTFFVLNDSIDADVEFVADAEFVRVCYAAAEIPMCS